MPRSEGGILERFGKRLRYLAVAQPGMQRLVLECMADWILVGGSRMGGKTFVCLLDWILHLWTLGGAAHGLIVRRTRAETGDLVKTAKVLFKPFGGKWVESKSKFVFRNGAELWVNYLDSDEDVRQYLGWSFTWILIEEVNHMESSTAVLELYSTLRSATSKSDERRFLMTCNWDGEGVEWLEEMFYAPAPGGKCVIWREFPELAEKGLPSKLSLIFFPSLPEDNREMHHNDPKALARLYMATSHSSQLREIWVHGKVGKFRGQFFDTIQEWKRRGAIREFLVPDEWPRFVSLDWGFNEPFSIGWWAICPDWMRTPESGIVIPPGAIVRYREYYGVKKNDQGRAIPNVGIRRVAEDVGRDIAEFSRFDPPRIYGVADPSAWGEYGHGESIMARIIQSEFEWYEKHGIRHPGGWHQANRRRVSEAGKPGGWNEVRRRLKGVQDPWDPTVWHPMMFVFAKCSDFFRTMPRMKHDPKRPEDMMKGKEDHVADETRYACASRPQEEFPQIVPKATFRGVSTVDDLYRAAEDEDTMDFMAPRIALGNIVESWPI